MAERIWLITGGSGQLGGTLAAAPPEDVRILAPARAVLDLDSKALDIAAFLAVERVTAIINCAAYTNVDRAEDEIDIAARVNGQAPGALARAAATADIPIVQMSTDYVFLGGKSGAYVEEDSTGPVNVYGRTKLAGEEAVAASNARHAILRTSWVFSAGGSNFVRTMLRLGDECDELAVVADQHGSPSFASEVASAVAEVTLALEDGRYDAGVWHIANHGETTRYGLAQQVFARAAQHGRRVPILNAVTTAQYPTRAPRPLNSRLDTSKLRRDFGIELRPWRDAVNAAVDAILMQEDG